MQITKSYGLCKSVKIAEKFEQNFKICMKTLSDNFKDMAFGLFSTNTNAGRIRNPQFNDIRSR